MWIRSFVKTGIAAGVAGGLYLTAFCAEPPEAVPQDSSRKADTKSAPRIEETNRVTIEVARDRAKVMHSVYEATLDVMHHRYFHRERSVVPARAMEDVFSEMKRQLQIEARWISVNLKPMSIDHEPVSEFEKLAAREIADGKTELDLIEDGYYRRAGVIPLGSGCVSCHAGLFKEANRTPKYAALVISVPIASDAAPK